MKNIAILWVFLGLFVAPTSAQLKVLDQFGNRKTIQGGIEPWYVQTTTNISNSTTDNVYHTGSVGMGDFSTSTLTQSLDVDGNGKIQSMPSVNIVDVSASNYPNVLVSNTDGSLGMLNIAAVPTTTATVLNGYSSNVYIAENSLNTMFVLKRYTVSDFPTGKNGGKGVGTGMNSSLWEAFILNIQYKFIAALTTATFTSPSGYGYFLGKDSSNWYILGDFFGATEGTSTVDILFIKKPLVATDR